MDKLDKNINHKFCETCDSKSHNIEITYCDGCYSEICSECEIRRMCCHDWTLKMFTAYCEDYVENEFSCEFFKTCIAVVMKMETILLMVMYVLNVS